jgi:ADP-heptose:LPS heptosyltransferase
VGTRNVAPQVTLTEPMKEWGRDWLRKQGWKEGETLVVVHPGMGGSALNWPENHYVEMIRALLKEGHKVLVTAGPTEGTILTRIQQELGAAKDQAYYHGGPDVGPVDQLAGLFHWARLVIAPSTGPLHLAVALGKPVVCFYPPIAVQSAIRWGPYCPDESKASILVPEVYCGEEFKCRGTLCNYFPCMKSLTVTQALEEAQRQLARAEGEPHRGS